MLISALVGAVQCCPVYHPPPITKFKWEQQANWKVQVTLQISWKQCFLLSALKDFQVVVALIEISKFNSLTYVIIIYSDPHILAI